MLLPPRVHRLWETLCETCMQRTEIDIHTLTSLWEHPGKGVLPSPTLSYRQAPLGKEGVKGGWRIKGADRVSCQDGEEAKSHTHARAHEPLRTCVHARPPAHTRRHTHKHTHTHTHAHARVGIQSTKLPFTTRSLQVQIWANAERMEHYINTPIKPPTLRHEGPQWRREEKN